MSELLLLAVFGLVWTTSQRAARAEAHVAEVARMLRQAEDAWAVRHRASVAYDDSVGAAVAMSTQGDILRARVALEADYG